MQAALFDMDGLMFDTERIMDVAWREAGRQTGENITDKILLRVRGTNYNTCRDVCLQSFGDSFDFKAFHILTHDITMKILNKNVPHRPGLVPLLEYLKQNNFKMAVASSSKIETVNSLLVKAGVDKYFSAVIGGDMVQRSKPEPDIYLAAAKAISTDAADCYAFEDSFNGVISASSAGCHTIMIPDMDMPTQEIKALCKVVLPSLDSAIKYMEELK